MNVDWKWWFEEMSRIDLNGKVLGPNTQCIIWEQMYQAFKARYNDEIIYLPNDPYRQENQ